LQAPMWSRNDMALILGSIGKMLLGGGHTLDAYNLSQA
jgi:hypothetical protein